MELFSLCVLSKDSLWMVFVCVSDLPFLRPTHPSSLYSGLVTQGLVTYKLYVLYASPLLFLSVNGRN